MAEQQITPPTSPEVVDTFQVEEGVTAHVVKMGKVKKSGDVRPAAKAQKDPFKQQYSANSGLDQVLEPPYSMDWLARAAENNSILQPCVDSMAVNTGGFGYQLVPTIDLDRMEDGPEKEKIRKEMDREKQEIESFFNFCHPDESFISLTMKRGVDKHQTGNAYWEITRYGNGRPAGIEHVPSYNTRLALLDKFYTTFIDKIKVSSTEYQDKLTRKYFRRFCQINADGRKTWYKEFGDPRALDAKTGKWLTVTRDNGSLRLADGVTQEQFDKADKANEIIHFRHYCTYSPYGVPKWIGNTLSVVGARAYEEINMDFADNKAIPPLCIMVSGGKLKGDSVQRIRDYVEQNLKGRNNFHSILILETDVKTDPNMPGQTSRGAIDLKPLTEAIQKDELFSNYDKRARDKIRGAFRLPPIYAGDTQDYTRATAQESTTVAEKQVFQPERVLDDHAINRKLLAAMGVRYWEFQSNTAIEDSATEQATIYRNIRAELTVNEGRRYVAKIINTELPPLKSWWAKDVPIGVVIALLQQRQAELLASVKEKSIEVAAQAKGIDTEDTGEGDNQDQVVTPGAFESPPEADPPKGVEEKTQVAKSSIQAIESLEELDQVMSELVDLESKAGL